MLINHTLIDDMAVGGAFLATGGGGDMIIGRLSTKEALRKYGEVELVPLDQIGDQLTIAVVGGVGSPTIMLEKMGNGMEAMWALDALEEYLGRKIDALMAMEAGGFNALVPFAPAAMRGLPVVDADGMGRAFPELQMETFSIYGVSPTPLAITGDLGDTAIITHTRDPFVAEKLVRNFAIHAGGGHCMSAEHVMDGATAKRVSIPGTISLCLQIGEMLRARRGDLDGFMEALAAKLAGTHYGETRLLFRGRVSDVSRRVEAGFDMGEMFLESLDNNTDQLKLVVKNEFIVAWKNGDPVCMVPDLICMVDLESAEPVTAERVRYGHRVAVIGIGAPSLYRTALAIPLVDPRAFGFDFDYVQLEDL